MAEDDVKTESTEKQVEKSEKKADKEATKPKKMAVWKKVLLWIVAFFVGVFLFAFVFTRDAQQAGDEFLAQLQAGECTALYDKTSEQFRSITGAEEWDGLCNQVYPILQGEPNSQGVEVQTVEGGQIAETSYTVAGTDNETYIVSIQLVKSGDNDWQLNGINSELQPRVDAQPEVTETIVPIQR